MSDVRDYFDAIDAEWEDIPYKDRVISLHRYDDPLMVEFGQEPERWEAFVRVGPMDDDEFLLVAKDFKDRAAVLKAAKKYIDSTSNTAYLLGE